MCWALSIFMRQFENNKFGLIIIYMLKIIFDNYVHSSDMFKIVEKMSSGSD